MFTISSCHGEATNYHEIPHQTSLSQTNLIVQIVLFGSTYTASACKQTHPFLAVLMYAATTFIYVHTCTVSGSTSRELNF